MLIDYGLARRGRCCSFGVVVAPGEVAGCVLFCVSGFFSSGISTRLTGLAFCSVVFCSVAAGLAGLEVEGVVVGVTALVSGVSPAIESAVCEMSSGVDSGIVE